MANHIFVKAKDQYSEAINNVNFKTIEVVDKRL